MEKIIYLEPDDEITTVIDKIKKVKQTKIVLVVPKAATILQSIVNLKILKNQAFRLGKGISIVTSDETGKNLASQIGLSVYSDLGKKPVVEIEEKEKKVEKIKEREKREKPKEKVVEEIKKPEKKPEEPPRGFIDIRSSSVEFKPHKDEKRAGIGMETISPRRPIRSVGGIDQSGLLKKLKITVIVLLFLALLEAVAGYFILPRAEVKVVLKAEKLDKTYEIIAQKDVAYNEETSTLPASVYSLEKETSKDFPTTGTKEVGEKAKGTITVFNETGVDQPLVATTRFVTSAGLVFRSNTGATVPKAYLDPGGNKINGTVNVAVTADASGEKYNIASSNFSIPGLAAAIQSKVYGRSSAAMSGGSTRKIKIVSEADIKGAETELLTQLINSSREEISAKANQGEEIVFEGAAAGVVISSVPNPVVNTEAETFNLVLKAQINLIAVKKSDYYNLLTAKANKEISQDKELLAGELEKTTESKVMSIDPVLNKMVISSHVTAPVVARMDMEVMKSNLKGKSAADAVKYLESFEEVSSAEVSLWPFFAKKVPNVKRIFITKSYQL